MQLHQNALSIGELRDLMMKVKKMIINRLTDWYSVVDVNTDPFYLAMVILEKLSTRLKRGLQYDRMNITYTVFKQRNCEIIENFDKAITILVSRKLIVLEDVKDEKKRMMITTLGQDVLNSYKEELKNEN